MEEGVKTLMQDLLYGNEHCLVLHHLHLYDQKHLYPHLLGMIHPKIGCFPALLGFPTGVDVKAALQAF